MGNPNTPLVTKVWWHGRQGCFNLLIEEQEQAESRTFHKETSKKVMPTTRNRMGDRRKSMADGFFGMQSKRIKFF